MDFPNIAKRVAVDVDEDVMPIVDWVKGCLILAASGSPHEIATEVDDIDVEVEIEADGVILHAPDGGRYKVSVHKIS